MNKTKQNSNHYGLTFKDMKSNTALAQLFHRVSTNEDASRFIKYNKWLEAFHLKNTITEQVELRKIKVNGHQKINFSSCSYLGLEQHHEVIQAAQQALQKWGNHAGSSRIFSTQENLMQLENEIAQYVDAESALVGINVSQIHQGTIPALFSGNDCVIFIDRHAHTSMYQASLIAKAKGTEIVRVDTTTSLDKLKKTLIDNSKKTKVLLVDGVYSMQGTIPAFAELEKICTASNTVLYVDDAHGLGVVGATGAGVRELFNLSFENLILVGGFQKAMGSYGAFVAAKKSIIDLLRILNKAYIFSGPLQPQAVESSRKAIEISQSEEGIFRRHQLKKKTEIVRSELLAMGYQVGEVETPILPIFMGSDIKTLMAGRKLFDEGVYISSVLYPAVPKNEGILRLSLNAIHTDSDIETLLAAFKNLKIYLDDKHSAFYQQVYEFTKEVVKSKVFGKSYSGL